MCSNKRKRGVVRKEHERVMLKQEKEGRKEGRSRKNNNKVTFFFKEFNFFVFFYLKFDDNDISRNSLNGKTNSL